MNIKMSAPTAYCDYIAHLISKHLLKLDTFDENLLLLVNKPRLDLNVDGSFRSTKKTVELLDNASKKYRITVEEVD